MEVKIPEHHRKAIARVSAVEDSLFASITEALNQQTPCLLMAEFRTRVRSALASILPGDGTLAEALVALAATSSGQDFDPEFLRSVVESVSADEELAEETKNRLRLRLDALLRLPFIHVSAKSSILQVAHDRVFNAAKVITDVRPVFNDPIDTGFVYMVIHHLQIKSVRGGETEITYLSMDDKDLDALEAAVVRAREKAVHLRKTLNSSRIREIDGAAE